MIITLASSKGGVGKSTTTASIAGAFAYAGHRVHIIDLDSNHTVSRWLGDAGRSSPRLTVSAADPQDLTEHLTEISTKHKPDVTLIDIAGTYERALTVAIARAHLTIIPAGELRRSSWRTSAACSCAASKCPGATAGLSR